MQYQVRNSKETNAVELKYNDTLEHWTKEKYPV
jgi:hypothetical protein